MAVDIGPRIGIDGEAEYRAQLNNIIQQTKTLGSQMKALSAEFQQNGNSMQANRQKAELLTSAIEKQKAKLTEQKRMLQEASNSLDQNSTKTEKWKQVVAESEAELARLENELRMIPNSLQVVGQKMQDIGAKMSSVGRNMSMYVTAPLVALGTAAVKVTADFDSAMSKVSAISGATGNDLAALRDKAKEMGETTKFSATESAEAFEYMAMAGWKTEDMLSGISGVMDLAAASGTDLATTSDILTDSLTAFGLSAEDAGHMADVMAAASSNANTNVEMMGETFSYAAPIAGAFGFTVEDTAEAIGLMANAGIKSSQAGTALRRIFTTLSHPIKITGREIGEVTIQTQNADGTMRSLAEILAETRTAFDGLTEAEQIQAAESIAGKNAMSGFLALINAAPADVAKLEGALNNADGTAKKMAETMQDNLAGQLTLLKSQLEGVGIQAGEILVPYLRKGLDAISDILDGFKKLPKETQENIVKFGAFAAAIGPVLMVTGKLTSGVGKLIEGFGNIAKHLPMVIGGLTGQAAATTTATGAQLALNAAMYAMPVIGIVAAVAGVVAAFVSMGEAAKEAYKDIQTEQENLESLKSTADQIKGTLNDFTAGMKGAGQESRTTAKEARDAADTLLSLSKSGDKSRQAMAQMAVATKTLNSIYPNLNLEFDRSTGTINKTAEEIEGLVGASEKLAKTSKYADQLETSMKGVEAATADLVRAQDDLDKITSDQAKMQARVDLMRDLGKSYNEGKISLDEFKQSVADAKLGLELIDEATISYNGEIYNAQDLTSHFCVELEAFSAQAGTAQSMVDAASRELDIMQQSAANAQSSLDALNGSTTQVGAAMTDSAEKVQYSITAVGEASLAFQQLGADEQQLAIDTVAAMTQIQESVTSALSSQMDMFSAFQEKSAMSTQTLLDNMQSQIDGVTKWEENLALLADKGIDQDLLQKLSAMGPEGSGYVQTFANMTAGEMEKANELWKQGLNIQGFGNDEAQELQAAVGTMAAGGQEAFAQLGIDLGIAADTAGKDTAQGLINGLQALQGEVQNGATTLGDDVIEALNTALGTHSPSTITTQSGKDVDQGLANGIKEGTEQVKLAINSLNDSIDMSLIQKLTQYAQRMTTIGSELGTNLANGIRGRVAMVASACQSIVSEIQNATTKIQAQAAQWQSAGQNLSEGLAKGILAGQSSVINAAVTVAQQALAKAKAELGIASPSKVADKEIGQMFSAGVARGIDNGLPLITQSMRDMMALVTAPQYANAFASGAGVVNNNSMTYEGANIVINAAPGQDAEEIAAAVSERLNAEYVRTKSIWGIA